MRWGQQVPRTHKLSSSMQHVCPIHLYPMNVWMHIKLPSFLILSSHLPPLVIFLCFFSFFLFLSVCLNHHVFFFILYGGLPASQFWPGICSWCIIILFSSTVICMLSLYFVIFCVFVIYTGNETGSHSGFWGASFSYCGIFISRLN